MARFGLTCASEEHLRTFSRRTFGLGVLGVTIASKAEAATPRARVGSVSALAVGEPVNFSYPEPHAAILVRLAKPAEGGVGPNSDIVAFHVACPHMGCALAPGDELASGVFGPCGCHGSAFDLRAQGRQLYGRASQNLVQVQLEVSGDDIFAVGIVGLPFGEAVAETP